MARALGVLAELDDGLLQEQLAQLLRRAGSPRAALSEVGQAWVSSIEDNFRAGGRPKKWAKKRGGEASHLKESGRLAHSIRHRVLRDGVQVGTSVRGARLHHFGGVIRPKRKKFLAIPTSFAPKTIARAGAGALFRRYAASGQVFSTFKGGKGTVFFRAGKSGKPVPYFVLRKKVTMPARPFLMAQRRDLRTFSDIIATHLTRGMG